MAFEANNFNVARKVVLPKSEVNVECNISITDEITKVLSVSAETCVSGSEVLNGVINYSAYADVCIVYLNNEGEIGKVNSTCPFSSKTTATLLFKAFQIFICHPFPLTGTTTPSDTRILYDQSPAASSHSAHCSRE